MDEKQFIKKLSNIANICKLNNNEYKLCFYKICDFKSNQFYKVDHMNDVLDDKYYKIMYEVMDVNEINNFFKADIFNSYRFNTILEINILKKENKGLLYIDKDIKTGYIEKFKSQLILKNMCFNKLCLNLTNYEDIYNLLLNVIECKIPFNEDKQKHWRYI